MQLRGADKSNVPCCRCLLIIFSQKHQQTTDMTEYMRSSISTKETSKAVTFFKPSCTLRTVELI